MDEEGVAKKCTHCINLKEPVCVLTCPKNALKTDSKDIATDKREKVVKELEKVKAIMKY